MSSVPRRISDIYGVVTRGGQADESRSENGISIGHGHLNVIVVAMDKFRADFILSDCFIGDRCSVITEILNMS